MQPFVDRTGNPRAWQQAGAQGPPVDLYETPEAVVIRLAIPGAEGSSLSLSVGEDSVTVSGESGMPGREWTQRTVVHWQEIPYGRFRRVVPLPGPVDARAVRAQFRNGLLDITLPKAGRTTARTIPITFQ
jgi:HSP20 family protein